jgi:hypothetical protein
MTMRGSDGLFRQLRRMGAVAAMAGLLGACAQTAHAPAEGADPLVVSQSTNAALQEYLGWIYPNKRGAFAVSADGANSFAYYCPDVACPTLYGGYAVSHCQSLSNQDCYLFYVARQPRVAYTVAAGKGIIGRHGSRRALTTEELTTLHD